LVIVGTGLARCPSCHIINKALKEFLEVTTTQHCHNEQSFKNYKVQTTKFKYKGKTNY